MATKIKTEHKRKRSVKKSKHSKTKKQYLADIRSRYIRLNMREMKKGKTYKSPKMAIAAGYTQAYEFVKKHGYFAPIPYKLRKRKSKSSTKK